MSQPKPLEDLLADIRRLPPIECGEEAAKYFAFDDGYTNLNHGSYGTYPIPVRAVFRRYQELTEARPDEFVRYRYRTDLLDEARAVLARYLQVPTDTCVFAPNATLAFDTILHNFTFDPNDTIICFSTIYGSFANTLTWLSETSPVEITTIPHPVPMSPSTLCTLFESTIITTLRKQGKTPRLAVFDTIHSIPALCFPYAQLTALCKSHGILSVIDAAHGIGHFPLHLSALDPDFLVSNCHKWLHVPRGCAVLYVPRRNQGMLRATLPTGFGFVPKGGDGEAGFVGNFASLGTLDDNPYLCVEAALEWRGRVTWGDKRGEEAVMGYVLDLARRGGEVVAGVLGTEVLGGEADNGMVNVRLPLDEGEVCGGDGGKRDRVTTWIMKSMIVDHSTACLVMFYAGAWWVRLSAQIYLTTQDFESAARRLIELCEAVRRGRY